MMMRARFRNEPYNYTCPRCGIYMTWSARQGRLGGWRCSRCGLQIDYKGY